MCRKVSKPKDLCVEKCHKPQNLCVEKCHKLLKLLQNALLNIEKIDNRYQ